MPPFEGKIIKPIALPGQYICIEDLGKCFMVEAIEPIPSLIIDFGALDAGAQSGWQELKKLYLWDNHLGQYRAAPIEDIQMIMKANQTPKFVTKEASAEEYEVVIEKWHGDNLEMSNLTEFFIYSDKPKLIANVKNVSGAALTQSRVRFFGFKYKLKEVEGRPEKYVSIRLGALIPQTEA